MIDSGFEVLLSNEDTVLVFLANNPEILHDNFSDGSTLLHKAASCGSPLLVYYIMLAHPEPAFWVKTDTKYKTAACYACGQGYAQIIAIMHDFFTLFGVEVGLSSLRFHRSVFSRDLKLRCDSYLSDMAQVQFDLQKKIQGILSGKSWFECWGLSPRIFQPKVGGLYSAAEVVVKSDDKSMDVSVNEIVSPAMVNTTLRRRKKGIEEREHIKEFTGSVAIFRNQVSQVRRFSNEVADKFITKLRNEGKLHKSVADICHHVGLKRYIADQLRAVFEHHPVFVEILNVAEPIQNNRNVQLLGEHSTNKIADCIVLLYGDEFREYERIDQFRIGSEKIIPALKACQANSSLLEFEARAKIG